MSEDRHPLSCVPACRSTTIGPGLPGCVYQKVLALLVMFSSGTGARLAAYESLEILESYETFLASHSMDWPCTSTVNLIPLPLGFTLPL